MHHMFKIYVKQDKLEISNEACDVFPCLSSHLAKDELVSLRKAMSSRRDVNTA